MSEHPPIRPKALEWVPLAGLVIVLAGIIFGGGALSSQARETAGRVERIEPKIEQLLVAVARIEGKVEHGREGER